MSDESSKVLDLEKVAHERLTSQLQEAKDNSVHGRAVIEIQFVGGKPIAVKDCLERTHRAK